ncbi:MAG: sialate O-acetylesterase [Ginsengibacter sp.]
MKKIILTVLCVLIMGSFIAALAEIRLPAIIGSHMVLQQKSQVNIWGWSDPSEKITISTDWDTITYHAIGSSNGKWLTQINTPVAGGPYKIAIQGHNLIVLEDVLIGEVWDCSGQSNMEMNYSEKVKEYSSDVENATNKSIRFFHIPRLSAMYPQDDTKAKWVVCNPEDMKRFSLAGYFFGQKLQQSLGNPVGLINASWGGTPAETWTPKEVFEQDTLLNNIAVRQKEVPWGPVMPAYAYNAMIYPITNYSIAGVLWYQGEANVGNASTYNRLLTAMINSWRKAWQKDLPFYIVQIAPFAGYGNTISSALLREAQTKTLSIPNTGLVVISDLVSDTADIHPKNKKDVGLRLANSVLAEVYGKKEMAWKSPMYKNMQIEKGKIRIYFDNAETGLISKGGAPSEFYIAGDDKKFVPAAAKIEKNTIVVWNKDIAAPAAVRFGFTSAAIPNVFNKDGLPVNSFRTDEWNDVNTR